MTKPNQKTRLLAKIISVVTLTAGLAMAPSLSFAKQDHNGQPYAGNVKNHHYSSVRSGKDRGLHTGHKRKFKQKYSRHHSGKYDRHHYDRHEHVRVISRPVHYYYLNDHAHYDPRLSIGLHLGHFDLYFED
jgi:Ni/Co efflux regulator RcnB